MTKKPLITLVAAIVAAVLTATFTQTNAQTASSPNAVDTVSTDDFTPVGKAYDVDFGEQQFRLEFVSTKEMKFTSPDGKNTAVVAITVTKIRPNVFMVYWTRRAGQHVVHVEDFENGVAYSNIFLPDGTAQRLKGTLTLAR